MKKILVIFFGCIVAHVSIFSPCHATMSIRLHLGAGILFKDNTPGTLDRCSIGLKAVDSSGRDGFITAGHCAHKAGQKVFIKYRDHKIAIGKMMEFVPYRRGINPDFGFVVLRHDSNVAASVDHSIPGVGEVTGVYRGAIPYGSIVCKRGSTSGVTCGRVAASGARFAYFGNRGHSAYSKAMSSPGDSGGVVFYKDAASGGIVAIGIVTDVLEENFYGMPPGFGVVQMISDIEKVLRITVV